MKDSLHNPCSIYFRMVVSTNDEPSYRPPTRRSPGHRQEELKVRSWTPKVCKIIAFWAILSGFGPLLYILWGSRVALTKSTHHPSLRLPSRNRNRLDMGCCRYFCRPKGRGSYFGRGNNILTKRSPMSLLDMALAS